MSSDFPVKGVELTVLLVVSDIPRSVRFYTDVLGATLFREYGGTSAVLEFQGNWLLLVTGGDPTEGKPTVTFAPPADPDRVSQQLTMRVPNCQAAYDVLRSRGAEFLALPSTEAAKSVRFSETRTDTFWRSARFGSASRRTRTGDG